MQLIVLGSGTSVPHSQRASTAFWLEADGGSMLLDCSADAMHRMALEYLDWPNLDAIWISHLHLDHCGGLASLLFAMKHSPQTQARRKPLRIFSCSGVERLLKAIDESNDYGLFKQPFPLEVREFAELRGNFSPFEGIRCETFKTPHTRESLAMRLTNSENKTVVYSADTGVSEELAIFARGADLFVLECSFYENKPVQTHLNLAEAMRIAQMAEPRRLLLTHLYPEWDAIDLPAKARELWPGETIAASDGLRIEI
ncbi:MAG TPA: MBL fold metallo-hydrolase [Pyrinomonadaceae bacterium]|nr:MBL fold metallo-hydrolase [Pyrinomonadaceae bacterium]